MVLVPMGLATRFPPPNYHGRACPGSSLASFSDRRRAFRRHHFHTSRALTTTPYTIAKKTSQKFSISVSIIVSFSSVYSPLWSPAPTPAPAPRPDLWGIRKEPCSLAESVGFEPTVPLRAHTISSRAQSSTLATLRGSATGNGAHWVQALWRREWDSNPRWSCPHTGFRDRRIRPLCHLSAASLRDYSTGQAANSSIAGMVHVFLRQSDASSSGSLLR